MQSRLFLLAVGICAATIVRAAGAPSIDKMRFAAYVRYAEGLTNAVAITVEEPTPSSYRDYYRLVVHLTAGQLNLGDKLYYVSPDGKQFVNGTVWSLDESPFRDILSLLPTNGPSFGPKDAKITVVLFSDFECPYCKQLAETVRQNIPKTFPTDVRIVFADFPLESKHLWARAAAEAGHCIGDTNQDAFWSFHDWIFEHQGEIEPKGANLRDKILQFAKDKSLDAQKIGACMETHTTAGEVAANEKIGYEVGVQQTPTIFVDGRKIEGALPWANLEALLRFELKRPQDIPMPSR